MKNKFTLEDIPDDVMWVMCVSQLQFVGGDTYLKAEKIIKDNPKWFPWEHKYASIPQEVHDAFGRECYPEREVFSDNIGMREKIEMQVVDIHTPTSIEQVFANYEKQQNDKIKEEKRVRRIWDKHYKKYGLSYRE